MQNRSMPASTVIPVLAYADVEPASRWLCEAFGFELRLTVGNHRIQLGFGDGAVVLTEVKGKGRYQPVARSPSWCVSKTLTSTMTVSHAWRRHPAPMMRVQSRTRCLGGSTLDPPALSKIQ